MNVFAQAAVAVLLFSVGWSQIPSDSPAAPGVEVVKNSWRKIVRNPALDDDPFRANAETADFEREKKNTTKLNEFLRAQGRQPVAPPMQRSSGMRMDRPATTYVYEVKIRNTGTRTLQAIVWDYAFFDNEKQEEIGRTTCTSRVNLRPGKTLGLVGSSTTPPIRVVDVAKSGKELKGTYTELVVITRLEYEDGSFWQRPLD